MIEPRPTVERRPRLVRERCNGLRGGAETAVESSTVETPEPAGDLFSFDIGYRFVRDRLRFLAPRNQSAQRAEHRSAPACLRLGPRRRIDNVLGVFNAAVDRLERMISIVRCGADGTVRLGRKSSAPALRPFGLALSPREHAVSDQLCIPIAYP
jgi:hypothetical protein